MSDEQQFIIVVRFPAWEMDGHKSKAFAVKYFLTMPIIPLPEWKEDDKRWFSYSEEKIVAETFKKAYKDRIRKDRFDGEILFIEPVQLTSLKADEVVGAV